MNILIYLKKIEIYIYIILNNKIINMSRKINHIINKRKYSSIIGGNDDDDDIDIPVLDKIVKPVFNVDNHIYFTGNVTMDSVNKLVYIINDLNTLYDELVLTLSKNKIIQKDTIKTNPIYLHINSCGGLLIDGFRATDIIESSKIPIYTIVEGEASSAASLMFLAGKKRYMTKNSVVLIHQLRSGTSGTHDVIEDEYKNNIMYMDKMKKFYIEKTNGCLKKTQLDNLLKRDTYLDVDTCLKYNLVDEIIVNV
jgi:ATP-dependent protease ClpP protease subunit